MTEPTSTPDVPIVLLDPHPRTSSEIFAEPILEELKSLVNVIERGTTSALDFYSEYLPRASAVIGQPALTATDIESAPHLKAIINVEGNFLQNMDYQACFRKNIHVLSISPVFAQPVAELALGLALALARNIPSADADFKAGREVYGLASNQGAKLLHNCQLGFVGFGDLGRAIRRVFSGLSPQIRIYDPWLSPEMLARESLQSCSLDEVLSQSDLICVVASPTSRNKHFISTEEFNRMKAGTLVVFLSRAEVVDVEALMRACSSGHILAATDVFPEEPLPIDHPLRSTPNLILSAHRAGALQSALFEIGERVLADIKLICNGLPPQNCKRAEPELVGMIESKPVSFS